MLQTQGLRLNTLSVLFVRFVLFVTGSPISLCTKAVVSQKIPLCFLPFLKEFFVINEFYIQTFTLLTSLGVDVD